MNRLHLGILIALFGVLLISLLTGRKTKRVNTATNGMKTDLHVHESRIGGSESITRLPPSVCLGKLLNHPMW